MSAPPDVVRRRHLGGGGGYIGAVVIVDKLLAGEVAVGGGRHLTVTAISIRQINTRRRHISFLSDAAAAAIAELFLIYCMYARMRVCLRQTASLQSTQHQSVCALYGYIGIVCLYIDL